MTFLLIFPLVKGINDYRKLMIIPKRLGLLNNVFFFNHKNKTFPHVKDGVFWQIQFRLIYMASVRAINLALLLLKWMTNIWKTTSGRTIWVNNTSFKNTSPLGNDTLSYWLVIYISSEFVRLLYIQVVTFSFMSTVRLKQLVLYSSAKHVRMRTGIFLQKVKNDIIIRICLLLFSMKSGSF
jgi:hypothetical protein